MEITYVYYSNYDSSAAHGKQIIHTCNTLCRQGHDLTLIAAGDIRGYSTLHEMPIEFEVAKAPLHLPGSRPDRLVYYVHSLFRARRSDIIFTRDIRFLKFLTLIRWTGETPILYEAHKAYHTVENMSRADEQRYIGVAGGVVAISNRIRSDLEEMDITVTDIIPSAAPLGLIPADSKSDIRDRFGIDRKRKVFVYAGSLDPVKADLSVVIQGIYKLVDFTNPHLVLVGGNESENERVFSEADSVGLPQDRLTITGRVPHAEVFEYLKMADVGLVPLNTRSTTFSKYTSPLKLYEYLICGLSVVASDVPSIKQVQDEIESMILYRNGSVDSFVHSCQVAIKFNSDVDNPEQYSYKNRGEKLTNIFEELV